MEEIPEDLFRLAQHNKMMGNGKRLVLLEDLSEDPESVSGLSEKNGWSIKSVSHHLDRLRSLHMVQAETAGRHRLYRLRRRELYEKYKEIIPVITRVDD